MQLYHILRKIGLINYTEEEIDDYYVSKRIVKKYKKTYRDIKKKNYDINVLIKTLQYQCFIQNYIIGLNSENRDERISSIFALDGAGSINEINFLNKLIKNSDEEISELADKAICSIKKRKKLEQGPLIHEDPIKILDKLKKVSWNTPSGNLVDKKLRDLQKLCYL